METDNRRYLKIKIKHLAAEARIIRLEESKTYGMVKWKLQHHRKTRVRDAARQAQFAYGIIRGRSLSQVGCGYEPDFYREHRDKKEVNRMVMKYGPSRMPKATEKVVEAWFSEASRPDESVLAEHKPLHSVQAAPTDVPDENEASVHRMSQGCHNIATTRVPEARKAL